MPNETFNPSKETPSVPRHQFSREVASETSGYNDIIREIFTSSKELVQNELTLAKAEFKHVAKDTIQDLIQVGIFGTLLALSLLPFIAFLVIGLGELLNQRYWLSSLIVAVVFAAIGGVMAYRSFNKIKQQDIDFTVTKNSLRKEKDMVQSNLERIKQAAKGDNYESAQLH